MNAQHDPVVRTPLLTAVLADAPSVERVEIKRITLAPNQRSGLHLHPCPVLGMILSGSVFFQVDGQEAVVLEPGEAFFEPANVNVPHFDAREDGATFVAHYLLRPGQNELIRMVTADSGSPRPYAR